MASPRVVGGRVQTRRDRVGRVHGSGNQRGRLGKRQTMFTAHEGTPRKDSRGF